VFADENETNTSLERRSFKERLEMHDLFQDLFEHGLSHWNEMYVVFGYGKYDQV